jgi:hypothetical protein
MNADSIRERLTRQPFEPFELRLSTGENHQVRHPELVAIGKNRLILIDPNTDRAVYIALVHINSIEALQTA